jgi:hypothetical protein
LAGDTAVLVRNDKDLRATDPRDGNDLVRAFASGEYEVELLAKLLAEWVHDLAG